MSSKASLIAAAMLSMCIAPRTRDMSSFDVGGGFNAKDIKKAKRAKKRAKKGNPK